TNTLLISAPEPLYRNLREVIDQLDQRRAQEVIESLIVEVSEDDASEFGVQWQAGNLGGHGGFGGVNLGGSG
ncbi:secretin N-terminal domain-containing protein, partial [Escherichia coli]|uniref:secretin N-terminal domain-containing protein n=1 Tax=Escherichia coli TaxID=562 RepID=UPI002671E2C8